MNLRQFAQVLVLALAACAGTARAEDPAINFTGTWKLDRSASDPMREMLKAQGYNALEVSILERVPVTQIMTQTPGGLAIEVRSTVVKTSEQLHFDGQQRADKSNVLGPLTRLCRWSADGRQLLTTTRYNAKSGMGAEMTVTRTIAGAERSRLLQETSVRLSDGREFKARQVFIRLDTGSKG
ncbi:hypothetical protein AYO41_04540 [Verrucomicrobia bacterium SCGC AG-212-E04]|nr:hypothetical protein AYO41_04540 [Verrucomicrobia bacterium SCGC AG-212-E04]